jgi:hypothetical protein
MIPASRYVALEPEQDIRRRREVDMPCWNIRGGLEYRNIINMGGVGKYRICRGHAWR